LVRGANEECDPQTKNATRMHFAQSKANRASVRGEAGICGVGSARAFGSRPGVPRTGRSCSGTNPAAVSWTALILAVALHLLKLVLRVRAWQNILRASYPDTRVRYRDVFGAGYRPPQQLAPCSSFLAASSGLVSFSSSR
jgi:hypothetical protein